MDAPEDDYVRCEVCNFQCLYESLGVEEVITYSAPTPKPTWISDDDADESGNKDKHAIISEPCPKCANPEMYFYTMQLRSADEGST
eukprot:gene42794-56881_t